MNAMKRLDQQTLSDLLRSEEPKDRARAKRYIKQCTEGLRTEAERAAALGLKRTTWSSWRSDGIVQSLPKRLRHRGRPGKEMDAPVRLRYRKHWLTVAWVYVKHGADVPRVQRRRATVETSTGETFSLPSWEADKFIEAMRSFGWVDVQSA